MPQVQLDILMNPVLNRTAYNKQIALVKRSLGDLGDGIELIDEAAWNDAFDGIATGVGDLDESLVSLQNRIGELEDELANLSKNPATNPLEKFFQMDAIGDLGAKLSEWAEGPLETASALGEVSALTGKTGSDLDALAARGERAFLQIGGSIGSATKSLAVADNALGAVLDPSEVDAFLAKAAGIGQVWGKEIDEVIQKSRTFATSFNITDGDRLGNLVALGMQKAGGAMDDVMDSLDEYSQHLEQAGFTAEQSMGLAIRSIQSGNRDVDKVFDAVKEAKIRLSDQSLFNDLGDIDTPITATIQSIAKAAAAGEISIQDMLQQSTEVIEKSFDAGEIGPAVRAQLQAALAGSPAEEIGAEMWSKIFGSPIDTNAINAQAQAAGTQVLSALAPVNPFENLKREAEVAFQDMSASVAPFAAAGGSVLTTVAGIAPGLAALKDNFKIFEVGGSLLKTKLLPAIAAVIPGLFTQAAATGTATGAQLTLNTAMLANPIFLIITGIGLLIGAWVLFGDSTKEIGEATDDANASLEKFQETQKQATATEDQAKHLRELSDEYERLAAAPIPENQKRMAEIANEISGAVPSAVDAVDQLDASGRKVGETYRVSTADVRAFAQEQQQLAAEAREGALADMDDQAQALADSLHETKEEVSELRTERDELAREGLMGDDVDDDLRDVRKELGESSGKLREAEAAARKLVTEYANMGLSADDIAQRTGLTTEEVKKLAPQLGKSTDAAKGMAGAMGGVASKTGLAVQNAEALAQAYDKARSAVDKMYSDLFGAINQLKLEQRNSTRELADLNKLDQLTLTESQRQRQAFLQERLRALPGLIQAEIASAKKALQEKRQLEREETRTRLQIGEINLQVTDLRPQAAAIRREVGDMLAGIASEFDTNLVAIEKERVKAQLVTDLAELAQQVSQVKAQITASAKENDPAKKLIGGNDLLTALEAKRKALVRQAAQDELTAEDRVRDEQLGIFRTYLERAGAERTADMERQIAELERGLDRMGDSTEEQLDARESKLKELLATQRDLALDEAFAGNDGYVEIYGQLQVALRDADQATDDAARKQATDRAGLLRKQLEAYREAISKTGVDVDQVLATNTRYQQLATNLKDTLAAIGTAAKAEDREQLQNRAEFIKQQMTDYRNQFVTENRNILEIDSEFKDKQLQSEQELADKRFAIRIAGLERMYAREQQLLDRALARQASRIEVATAVVGEMVTEMRAADAQRQLAVLEKLHSDEKISDLELAEEQTRIQSEQARAEEDVQTRLLGRQLEIDRVRDLAQLALQREKLEKQKQLAIDAGNAIEAAAITQQLEELGAQIKDKGSTLIAISGELQDRVTDIMLNLFAGREDQALDSFRKIFQVIAGALTRLMSAKVTELIFSLITPTSGLGGLLTAIAARPFIEDLLDGVLQIGVTKLLSFSTGGPVNEPTLAVIGDGGRLGGRNREWVFTDRHLRDLVGQVVNQMADAMMTRLDRIALLIANMPGRFVVSGKDLVIAQQNVQNEEAQRIIGQSVRFAP